MLLKTRQYTMPELLAECEATLAREGRSICPVTDWVREHQDATIEEMDAWVTSQPLLVIPTCFAYIQTAAFSPLNPPEVAEEIQCVYARHLLDHPWADVRQPLEQFFRDNGNGDRKFFAPIAASAMKILIGIMAANHPNPKAFLMRDHIRRRIHKEIDLTGLPCPDYPHMVSTTVAGLL